MTTRPIRILILGGNPLIRAKAGNLLSGSKYFSEKSANVDIVFSREGKFKAWNTVVFLAPTVKEDVMTSYFDNLHQRLASLTRELDIILYIDSFYGGVQRKPFFSALAQTFGPGILKNLYIHILLISHAILAHDSDFTVQKPKVSDALEDLLEYHAREKSAFVITKKDQQDPGAGILGVLVGMGVMALKLLLG